MKTSKTIRGGFGSATVKPQINAGTLLPAGKHEVMITSVETEMPADNDGYGRDEDEAQLKVVMKNDEGITSAWLNSVGFVREDERGDLTAEDLPDDINYKALQTTAADFKKLPWQKKIDLFTDVSSDGYVIRKDTGMRLRSEKHTEEARNFAGNAIACALGETDEEYDGNQLKKLLVGKRVIVEVKEVEFAGKTRPKVIRFRPVAVEA